jgi:hypothetical protein
MTEQEVFEKYPVLGELRKKPNGIGDTDRMRLTREPNGFLPVLDANEQLERGQIFDLTVTHVSGSANECHLNSVELFEAERTLILASGFALAEDDVWYHHSWCIRVESGEKGIVETTSEQFKKYFGLEYQGLGGVEFADRLRIWLGPKIQPGSLAYSIMKFLQEGNNAGLAVDREEEEARSTKD